MGAMKFYNEKWTPELDERIEKLLSNGPEALNDWLTFIPLEQRRKTTVNAKEWKPE